jgi:hypothetical protein
MANIGTGRLVRVCDLCGGVDDHPRHVIAGTLGKNLATGESSGTPTDVFPAPSEDIVQAVLDAAPAADRARLIRDLMDTSSSDRHIDCCAAAGCPDSTCTVLASGSRGKTGKAMLSHLEKAGDAFEDRPDVVRALTAEHQAATPKNVGKAVRSTTALMLWLLMLATRGLSAVNLANAWLNVLRGTTFTGAAGAFIQLHTADPGASGTTAVSSVTTRPSATFSAASAGSMSMSGTVSWTSWAGTSPETVTDVSEWSASSAGTFYFSVQLTASKSVQTGDTLTLNTLSLSLSPIAA